METEASDVARICQLVEGLPLAIELAAAWTKSLNCTGIVREIERNVDFLTTSPQNVPDRQRSMRAVFETSWLGLTKAERAVFRRLSVFRGGFRREAAERVAHASLLTLTTLVDKSLLRWEADGRYQIHELLRQYAAEQLAQSPDDLTPGHQRPNCRGGQFERTLCSEWLGSMVTGRVVDYNPNEETYHLPAAHAALLTRAANSDNMAVFAQYIGGLGGWKTPSSTVFTRAVASPTRHSLTSRRLWPKIAV